MIIFQRRLSFRPFGLLFVALIAVPVFAADRAVVLLHDATDPGSELDCQGISESLAEAGMYFRRQTLAGADLGVTLADAEVAVLCHAVLDAEQASAMRDWVNAGGGLLVTGQGVNGLEPLLGVEAIAEKNDASLNEVRFTEAHPVGAGSFWDGAITQSPPMLESERPSIVQLLYPQTYWPGYTVQPSDGQTVARWRRSAGSYDAPNEDAAIVVRRPGQGRTAYSGALPGIYTDSFWEWPRSWRTVIKSSVTWLAGDTPLVSLGHWPDAHSAAFTWTGDTETDAMSTAVPALLEIFADFGLERFGTFYVTARTGDTEDLAGWAGAEDYPEVLEAIVMAGAEVAGHGDYHRSFSAESLATQRARMIDMVAVLDAIIAPFGERVRGFRAPFLSQDNTTFQALHEAGLEYDAGENDVWSETTLPYAISRDWGETWQLPPTTPMDWHLFVQEDVSQERARQIFIDKLDYVIARQGLFSWLHHPWVIEPELDLVRSLLAYATARDDIWMTRQDDVLDWWLTREELIVTSMTRGSGRLRATLSNRSIEYSAPGASLWLALPSTGSDEWVFSVNGQTRTPLIRQRFGQPHAVIVMPDIPPGADVALDLWMGEAVFRDGFSSPSTAR